MTPKNTQYHDKQLGNWSRTKQWVANHSDANVQALNSSEFDLSCSCIQLFASLGQITCPQHHREWTVFQHKNWLFNTSVLLAQKKRFFSFALF